MKRIPRPKGLTLTIQNYNKHKSDLHYKKAIDIIALNYINNEYLVEGQPMNTYQVAEHYQVSFKMLSNAINKHVQEMASYISQEDLVAAHRSILGRVFLGSEKDRALIHNQLQRLLAAQGDGYRPYISAEVNNALKLMLASTKNLIDLSDRIIPKNTEILNIMVNQGETENISVQDAIGLIRQEIQQALPSNGNKALPEKSTLQTIRTTHNLDEMPNVKANTGDEGANINSKASKLIEDPLSHSHIPSDIPEPEYLSDYEDLSPNP